MGLQHLSPYNMYNCNIMFPPGLMWSQYSINIFIYAYRSDQYRGAYWDVIVSICPYLKTFRHHIVQTETSQGVKSTRSK